MIARSTFRRLTLGVFCAVASLALSNSGEAQIVRGRIGGGVVVSAPFVRVQVGPIGISGRPYVLPRRRFVGPAPIAAPSTQVGPYTARQRFYQEGAGGPQLSSASGEYGSSPAPTSSPTPAVQTQASQQSYPTADQLRELDDAGLLNTLVDLSARLDARLELFNTGAGWQRHLQLPDDALPPPSSSGEVTLGMKSLVKSLDRYDAIAANPKYRVISKLPVFVATHDALQEVVNRFGATSSSAKTPSLDPFGADPTDSSDSNQQRPRQPSAEDLPPPEPTPRSQSISQIEDGQPRSILSR